MKQVKRFYDSWSQDHRWMIENMDIENDKPISFPIDEIRYLKAHGFTILTPTRACNDTFIDYATHRVMAFELNCFE